MEDRECTNITEIAEGPSICVEEQEEQPVEHHPSAVREEAAYGTKVRISKHYYDVLDATRRALSDEGLDVLSEVSLRNYFDNSLHIDFPNYTILGVCDPHLAHRALELDSDMGLLLQSNLVIYEWEDATILEAVDPIAQFAISDGSDLQDIARAVKGKLQVVIDHVAAGIS